MSLWLLLALGAAFLWSCANMVDKILLASSRVTPIVYVVLDASLGILPVICVLAFVNIHGVDPLQMTFGLTAGVTFFGFSYLYAVALTSFDVSSVVMVMQLANVGLVLCGMTFFHEVYSERAVVGMLLIMGASMGAILLERSSRGTTTFSRRTGLRSAVKFGTIMLSAVILLTLSMALQKYALRQVDYAVVYMLGRVGSIVGATVALMSRLGRVELGSFFRRLRLHPQRILVVGIPLEAVLNLAALLLVLLAYAHGPFGLVAVSASVQPVFVLILLALLSSRFVSMRPSSTTLQSWLFRFGIVTVLLAGAYLLPH